MSAFFLQDHQGKGLPYARALEAAGWMRSAAIDARLNLALFDHDVGAQGQARRPLDHLHQLGVPVVLYPHAARPMLQWDGMYPVWPHTRVQLVIGEGHREVLAAYGYPLPVAVAGWALCGLRAWQPVQGDQRPIEVLFGPIHPNHNGFLHPADRAANALVYQRLLEIPGIHLTVRHVFRLDLNGLWPAPGVRYVLANPNGKTDEIDRADVIVGHQTFAYLAVARGKPLVMFGDDITAHSGNAWDNLRWAAHYEAYRDRMRYPVEAEAARSACELAYLLDRAISNDAGAAWREKFIGQPLDPQRLVTTIQTYIN